MFPLFPLFGLCQWPLGPLWFRYLLGLLPCDRQQTGDAPGERTFPCDDEVPYGPSAEQVPANRRNWKSGNRMVITASGTFP